MVRFFSRERFGRPQVLAACLLLVFLAQCLLLVGKGGRPGTGNLAEIYRLQRGSALWNGRGAPEINIPVAPPTPEKERIAKESDASLRPGLENRGYDAYHSQLWYLIAAAPLWRRPASLQPENIRALHWSAALPYLMFGLLLGASLWYVARRLFGNVGGYVALALYCFSPGIIRSCALWFAEPEVGAAWGAFGCIFTGIAVAHTLYAPREVVLWNWRRILLLGLAIGLGASAEFAVVLTIPIALALMLYLVPERRRAACVIMAAAGVVGFIILTIFYGFRFAELA